MEFLLLPQLEYLFTGTRFLSGLLNSKLQLQTLNQWQLYDESSLCNSFPQAPSPDKVFFSLPLYRFCLGKESILHALHLNLFQVWLARTFETFSAQKKSRTRVFQLRKKLPQRDFSTLLHAPKKGNRNDLSKEFHLRKMFSTCSFRIVAQLKRTRYYLF